ncbi:MAG: hypothetical protein EZS28_019616, partial [Streblomastix strix]
MTRLFVGNLNYSTTTQELGQFMGQAGEVVGVTIPSGLGRGKGYGFVTMINGESAQRAISQLNSTLLDDRLVRVELSQHKHNSVSDQQSGSLDEVKSIDNILTINEVLHEISSGLNQRLFNVSLKENNKHFDLRRIAYLNEEQKKQAQDEVNTLKMTSSEYTRGFVEAFVDSIDMYIVLEHFGGKRFVEMKMSKGILNEDEWRMI